MKVCSLVALHRFLTKSTRPNSNTAERTLRRSRKYARFSLRRLVLERLSERLPLTAEGQAFSLNQTFDISAIGGAASGSILWGDGTSSAATIGTQPSAGPLTVRFDYSLDSLGFFAAQERRSLLQQTANAVVKKFSDQLLAITPSGSSTWTARFQNPSSGAQENRANLSIAANEILVFVGGRPLNANELGRGERGGFQVSSSNQTFINTVQARGQTGALATPATDFGPWGGSIAFASTANWHFGATTEGLDSNEFDFVGVASHELFHVLGFGLSASWNAKVAGGFTGQNATAVYGQSPVPLADTAHWQQNITINGQKVSMSPETTGGVRKLPTRLDLAGLQDIGWQLINPSVQVTGSHTYGDNGTYNASVVLNGSTLGTVTYPWNVSITNAAPVLSAKTTQSATVGRMVSFPRIGEFTDAGFGAAQATPPRTETFSYTISWGDGTPDSTGAATIESLGSAGVSTRGFFNGSHLYAREGTFRAIMTVVDDDGGSAQQQFDIVVGPPPQILLAIDRSSISEAAGLNSGSLTIRRIGFDTSVASTVSLVSSDSSELKLPAQITIPIGQTSIAVPVEAVDDSILDGTVRVLISANIGALNSNTISVDVLDAEQLTITLDRSTIVENAGAGASVLTIRRSNSDTSQALTVRLTGSDPTEASVPSEITILAGASTATVGITAVDDALFDGTQTVVFTASAGGYADGRATLSVSDFQPVSLVLQSSLLIEEDPTKRTTQVELSIRSPAPTGGITLQLSSNASTQLLMPPTVFIPAGQRSIPFAVTVVDDFVPQGNRNVRISASGPGVIAASVDLAISDNDPAFWTNPNNPFDVNNQSGIDPLDVLILINEINTTGPRLLDPAKDLGLGFIDPNRDGRIDPLDVLAVINEINRAR